MYFTGGLLTSNLPDFPVNCIAYQNGTNDGLYIGTDKGIYYTNSSMPANSRWVSYNQGLPLGIIQDLKINTNSTNRRNTSFILLKRHNIRKYCSYQNISDVIILKTVFNDPASY